MQRMFGSRNVPKVAKYAIVIYEFTRESRHDCYSETAEIKAKRLTRKMMVKLHKRLLKDKKYDVCNYYKRSSNFSDWIGTLCKSNTEYYAESASMYMLYCNQAVHPIIHELAQDYDPNDTESKSTKPFYYEIYKELTA